MSKEKMINFTGDMVRAILDGSKTMTRRPLRYQPYQDKDGNWCVNKRGVTTSLFRKNMNTGKMEPYSFDDFMDHNYKSLQPGDTMLVRERARCVNITHDSVLKNSYLFEYDADLSVTEWVHLPERIKPIKLNHCVPNGCFRELVRIKRKVVRVWYERIADISQKDALREGIKKECCHLPGYPDRAYKGIEGAGGTGWYSDPRFAFQSIWKSIYPGSWDRNDWVECTEFEGKALK